MEANRKGKFFGVFALVILLVGALLCFGYFTSTQTSRGIGGGDKDKVNADTGGSSKPELPKSFPRKSRQVQDGSFVQHFGGSGEDYIQDVLMSGDCYFVIGTTNSVSQSVSGKPSDFTALSQNVFLAKVFSDGELISCHTYETTKQMFFLSAALVGSEIHILAKCESGLFLYSSDYALENFSAQFYSGYTNGNLHYQRGADKLYLTLTSPTHCDLILLEQTPKIIYSFAVESPVNIFTNDSTQYPGGIDIIVSTPTEIILARADFSEGNFRVLFKESKLLNFLASELCFGQGYIFLICEGGKNFLITTDTSFKVVRKVALPNGDKTSIVKNGNILYLIDDTSILASLYCRCGDNIVNGIEDFVGLENIVSIPNGNSYFATANVEQADASIAIVLLSSKGLAIEKRTLQGNAKDIAVKVFTNDNKTVVFASSNSTGGMFSGGFGGNDGFMICL